MDGLGQLAALQYNLFMVAGKKRGQVFSVTDLGELAARLGSIDTFDRRGDVVWLDDFEDGVLMWEAVLAGVGAAVASDVTRSRSGGKSCKLTTGSTGIYTVEIKHCEPILELSRIGLEVHITTHASVVIYLTLDVYDGTDIVRGQIAYDATTNRLYYQNSSGAMVQLATGVNLYVSDYQFHAFKLVVDTAGEKYERLVVNDTEYDLSAYALRKAADATWSHVEVRLTVVGNNAGNYSVYGDDVIMTQNESANEGVGGC